MPQKGDFLCTHVSVVGWQGEAPGDLGREKLPEHGLFEARGQEPGHKMLTPEI